MNVKKLLIKNALRHMVGLALMSIVAVLCSATARAQNTQITIEGIITNAGSVPGIIVGDKYSMVVYYNPTQAPASTSGTGAFYNSFTINTIVDDKDGNKTFSTESGEQLFVNSAPGDNEFVSPPCCTPTSSGFELVDTTQTAFKTNALPTTLKLSDFNDAFVVIDNATANITSIKVVNTGGVMPAFITVGSSDPNGKVPTINGVPGSGVTNLDVAMPLIALTHGTSYEYVVAMQDINFTGTCQASFTVTQIQFNKTVTLDSGKTSDFSCSPGGQWAWSFSGKAIPDFPGQATLTGTVTYGTEKETTTTTVIFQ